VVDLRVGVVRRALVHQALGSGQILLAVFDGRLQFRDLTSIDAKQQTKIERIKIYFASRPVTDLYPSTIDATKGVFGCPPTIVKSQPQLLKT
jgi:hypothetical protein